MQSRAGWLVLGAIAVLCVIAGVRSCSQGDVSGIATGDTPRAPRAAAVPATDPAAEAQAAALHDASQCRDAAMYAAVATLQKYLAALGREDGHAEADAFWANGHPPAVTGEADLRTLRDMRGMRIQNGTPKALDSNAVPEALEIPVELRVGTKGAPLRWYRGWYRLRRVDAERWEITSASVDAVSRSP